MENNMSITFDADSRNESLARIMAAAFVTELDPTLEEINDIKTAVSEAVTNSVIHGYNEQGGKITMNCNLVVDDNQNTDSTLHIEIKDSGVGIEDIEKAKEPLFTTKPACFSLTAAPPIEYPISPQSCISLPAKYPSGRLIVLPAEGIESGCLSARLLE